MARQGVAAKIGGWWKMSRPPFHTVGMLPFLLGTFLAWRWEGIFVAPVFLLGLLAVILIMLSAYHAGEFFDVAEDELSGWWGRSRFAGGSGIVQAGVLPRWVAMATSITAIILAGLIGLVLQFGFETGPYTLPLGCLGGLAGFFYSSRPVRLVERGLGELCIGFCYGWLPLIVAFYIQTARIDPLLHWISIPIALTIFNVIFLNEYPDCRADRAAGKRNMLLRLGERKGSVVYGVVSVLAWVSALLSVAAGVPARFLIAYLPLVGLSAVLVVMMLWGRYRDRTTLEWLCGLNIIVNLGTTACYLFAYL